ncbi:hypothetical protein AAHA92_21019 [Salvia divinorum]|uniref:DUF547 domain-containing protein n=1 Tax=Salvia divinorum TaxID=28513 RepID=A0ABD1GJF4_SALDI
MARQNDHLLINFPLKYRESNLCRQEKKEELAREMIELLDELAMVEKEISRLETQINLLIAEPEHNERLHTQPGLQEWEHANQRSMQQEAPLAQDPSNISKRSTEKATSFETKALHFITKAIRGDYKLSDFTLNDKAINSKRFKENTLHNQKPSKRGPLLRRPSPSRHPTPKRDHALDMSTPLHPEEDNIYKWPPNKLSENIMRCLIFIFLRLLRTSRAMELEMPVARSTDFSLGFRAKTGSAGLVFPKDSRQQDPYGIFNFKESLIRDIGPYKNLVRFTSTSMDLKCIQNSAFIPLFQKLKNLMGGLEKVDLRFLSHRQKLAFWINMYNACIMHGYLQYGISSVSSPEKMLTLINQTTLNIAGNAINAQTIERSILRKPANSQEKQNLGGMEMMLHDLYGLKSSDPNIIFALCCSTRSSPVVKIYTAEGVTGELERSKLEYLQASIVVTSTKRIALPELLLRNMFDFGQDMGSLVEWLCQQLPTSGSLRKSIVDCFKQVHGSRASAVVEMLPYDFEFQYLFSV